MTRPPASPVEITSRPLAGLRVIELSGYVAAPLGGMTLAQLGADVIRVEPLGGSADRARMPVSETGTSLYWAGLNKGKRSIEVNLRDPLGRQTVADLVVNSGPRGGILLSNTEGFPELTYAALRERRPDLIGVQLTGYRDGRTAVDYTIQAELGLQDITGPEDAARPVNHVLPAWDIACGLYLAVGLLAAEQRRLLTGAGSSVRVALKDVAMSAVGSLGYFTELQVTGASRSRQGNWVYGSFGRDFKTADGHRLMLVVLTGRHWRRLVERLGLGDVVAALENSLGADFDSEAVRYHHRELLAGLVAPWFASRNHADVQKILDGADLLVATYRPMADFVADDAALLSQDPLFNLIDHPGIGKHWAPGSPVIIDGEQAPAENSPQVGEQTADVLRTIADYSDRELSRLQDAGAIR